MAKAGLTPPLLPDPLGPGQREYQPRSATRSEHDASQAIDNLRGYANNVQKDLDMLLSGVTVAALELTRASGSALALRTQGAFICRASAGKTAPPPGTELNASSGISGECLRTGVPQLCPDAMNDPRVDREASRHLGIQSLAVVPLRDESGVIGILEVFADRPHAFTASHLTLLNQLAEIAMFARSQQAQPPVPPPSRSQELADVQREEPAKHQVFEKKNDPSHGIVASAIPALPILKPQVPQQNESALLVEWRSTGTKIAAVAAVAVVLIAAGWGALREFRMPVSRATLGKGTELASDSRNVVSASTPPPGTISSNSATGTREKPSATLGPAANDLVVRASSNAPLRRVSPLQVVGPDGGLHASSGRNSSSPDDFAPPAVTQLFPDAQSSAVPSILVSSIPLPPEPFTVSQGVTGGTLIHRVTPNYPKRAIDEKAAGAVVLQGTVGEDGALHDLKVLSGDPRLIPAAQQAVAQWRYAPYQLNGKPVAMRTNITVQFKLP